MAAGTSYATRGVPMVPFFIFYSMFGFQRVGDLIWQAADARARGFLLGATAGRTTLLGEGLQHQDGHSLVLASTVPVCQAYDPAFAYEMAAIVRHGIERMYGPDGRRRRLLLPDPLQRELRDAAHARGRRRRASSRASTAGADAPDGTDAPGHDPVLGHRRTAPPARPRTSWPSSYGVGAELWTRHVLQAAAGGGAGGRALEPAAPRRGRRAAPCGTELLAQPATARSSPSPTS